MHMIDLQADFAPNEHQIQTAIKNQEFEVYYQPKVMSSDKRIYGAESLVRWHHPQHGVIPAYKFITVAEDSGAIVKLDQYVLHQTCQMLEATNQAGYLISISVNVSPKTIESIDFVALMSSVISQYNIAPEQLDLEITEHSAITNFSTVNESLKACKELGVVVSLDDFGTGHSSLAVLKDLPVDIVKIPSHFIKDIEADDKSTKLLNHIVSLSHDLNLGTVVEGIENEEQSDIVCASTAEKMQGYLYGRPLPKDDFINLLSKDSSRQANNFCKAL